MNTDQLLAELVTEPPRARIRLGRIVAELLLTMLLVIVVFLSAVGLRNDLDFLILEPAVAAKILLLIMLFSLSLPISVRSIRPENGMPRLFPLLIPLSLAGVLWGWTFIVRDPGTRFISFSGLPISECLGSILMLSSLPLALAIYHLRNGAPTRPILAGALSGLAVSSGAAIGYSLFCPMDDPLFYVTWYGIAIMTVMLAGAFAGHLYLRW